jgi:hypothetical protein
MPATGKRLPACCQQKKCDAILSCKVQCHAAFFMRSRLPDSVAVRGFVGMHAAHCGKRLVGALPMNEQPLVKLLLTPRQAAAALQLSERTLWELARRGEIKRLKINSSVRYDVKDLEAFIQAKKIGGAV